MSLKNPILFKRITLLKIIVFKLIIVLAIYFLLLILHRIDFALAKYFYSPKDMASFENYQLLRLIIRYGLWIIVILKCLKFYRLISVGKEKAVLNRTNFTLILLAMTTLMELPIFPCYGGFYEVFWEEFHFH